MRQSELEKWRIYTNFSDKYRKLLAIEFDEEDGKWYVQYQRVGTLLIRDRIYFMDKGVCRIETFSKWAQHGYSEEIFIMMQRRLEATP